MNFVIPIPSDDNGKLLKLLDSHNLEFTVTSRSYSFIMASIYNQSCKTSSIITSETVKTVIVNGNAEIYSRLATNGYTNYSVTLKSYFDLVHELFAEFYHDELTSICCSVEETAFVDDTSDDQYSSARQSPDPNYCGTEDITFDDHFSIIEDENEESDDEPMPKRKRYHYKYGKIYCECLQQCQKCRKHVLAEDNFSSTDILTHAFYHDQKYRYHCATCNTEWNNQTRRHNLTCKESNIIDILQPPNVPSSVIASSLECFPKAIEVLKERGQWNF